MSKNEYREFDHSGTSREFQYKILNRVLYTNNMLFKFKKVNSPCDFCDKELETKSVTPNSYFIFETNKSLSVRSRSLKKIYRVEILALNNT